LVAFVFLLLCFRAHPLDDVSFRLRTPGGDIREFALFGPERIVRSGCSRFYARPEAYLLFLPGSLVCGLIFFVRKKRGIAVLLMSVILCAAADRPFPRRTVERGLEAFTDGDYETACRLLVEAEKAAPCNSALLYDIALCHYVLDRLGDTVYFLRESIRANPQAKLPRDVLTQIEEDRGLSGQAKLPMALHPNIPFALTLLFCNLTFIGLGFLLTYRRGWIFISVVFLALLTVGGLSLFLGSLMEIQRPVAVVAAEVSELKKIPLSEVKAWMHLPEGSALKISGETDDYVLVRSESGLTGWIEKADVRRSRKIGEPRDDG
jgi:hypothetical protein